MSTPSIADPTERAWADVDLRALVVNARTVAAVSGARLLPMVKADGYGVGAVAVARALEPLDPWGFGVATVEEGAALRRAGIVRPILVFTPLHPAEIPRYLVHDLRPVVGDTDALDAWLAQPARPFHIEVDTGMSRTGFRWHGDQGWRDRLKGDGGFEGLFTHFHSAETDPASVQQQWERLQGIVGSLAMRPALVHAANSAAALLGTRYAADMVRPGIYLYGGMAGDSRPAPVVRLSARVVAVRQLRTGETAGYGATWTAPRDTCVATLGIGYADGMHRSLGNRGVVELHGRVVPMVGRVTMDFLTVAVDAPCVVGDVATVFGGLVTLDELAGRAGTISYELLTAMGPRVARRHAG